MRTLRLSVVLMTALVALSVAQAAPASAAGAASAGGAVRGAAAAGAAAAVGNGCAWQYVSPGVWQVVCSNSGGSPGSGGSGGSQKYQCGLQMLVKAQISFLGLPPPPKGDKWAAITCPGPQPFNGVTLVAGNGTPAVTPQELLQIAEGELRVPVLAPQTAPPSTRKGLVGLPEWFWIPKPQWQRLSVTVSAGPVWASVTATPVQLTFDPGGGLPGTSCPWPGTTYSAAAVTRQNPCTYTYHQSSALQPGGAYQASVSVVWRVTWTGSGGVGGTLNSGLPMPSPLSLRVAEGQALVTGR